MVIVQCSKNFCYFLDTELEKLKSLNEAELCTCPFAKYDGSSLEISNFLKIIIETLKTESCIIIKGLGDDKRKLIVLSRLVGEKIFYSQKVGYIDTFETIPFCDSLSETLKGGGFHTDFSSLDYPPKYVALQCVQTDPKHPYLGRNQVAQVNKIILKLETMFPNVVENLLNIQIPIRYSPTNLKWIKLLELKQNKYTMKIHTLLVDKKLLQPDHFFDGIAIQDLVHEVAMEVSQDFVLDIGDIVIFSNEHCLHRRGEASVVFGNKISNWAGRLINSVRFY